jgi:hypothetical protein
MYSTIPITEILIPLQLAQAEVELGQHSMYLASWFKLLVETNT